MFINLNNFERVFEMSLDSNGEQNHNNRHQFHIVTVYYAEALLSQIPIHGTRIHTQPHSLIETSQNIS